MGTYVGITGISGIDDISAICKIARPYSGKSQLPAIGFGLVHYLNEPSESTNIHQVFGLYTAIQTLCPNQLTIVHLNGWRATGQSTHQMKFRREMLSIPAALQINNFDWGVNSFKELKSCFPKHKFILPLNQQRTSIEDCIRVLSTNPRATYSLLIDSSEGRGRACDLSSLQSISTKLREIFPTLSLGIAGGLGVRFSPEMATTIQKLMPISLDAETGLWLNGQLNLQATERYLDIAFRVSMGFN